MAAGFMKIKKRKKRNCHKQLLIHILNEMNKFLEIYTVKTGSELNRKKREFVIDVFSVKKKLRAR